MPYICQNMQKFVDLSLNDKSVNKPKCNTYCKIMYRLLYDKHYTMNAE